MLDKHDWFYVSWVHSSCWKVSVIFDVFWVFLQYLHTGLVFNIIIFALQMKMRKHNIWVSNGFAGIISYQI